MYHPEDVSGGKVQVLPTQPLQGPDADYLLIFAAKKQFNKKVAHAKQENGE